jgi:AcrR family transcriptional regulator
VSLNESGVTRRRRGEELEHVLLAAAWDELMENGYSAFTIDAVAARAGTSRPVVYRRWPTKKDLMIAAISAAGEKSRSEPPNTGSLRSDMIAVLQEANRTRLGFAALLSVHLGSFYQESGITLAELREHLIGQRVHTSDVIMNRAIERGEVDPAKVTPRIANLPFDLFRHELLMTMKPMADEVIEEIIDTIFLPLVLRTPA